MVAFFLWSKILAMESDPNPMPEIVLFPRLEALGRLLLRAASLCSRGTPQYEDERFREPFTELYDTPLERPKSLYD